VRTGLEGRGVDILSSALMERAAFREIHITGRVPSQDAPNLAAASNIQAIANEVLAHLEKISEAA
jgi:chromosome partitioning protein